MKSINAKINQLSGLIGTKDINEWEDEFIKSVIHKTGNGSRTEALTEKQLTVIESIHAKHYAD